MRSSPLPRFLPQPLIGRQEVLRELDLAFERHELVVLVGPPGVGKTRLALEYAQQRSAPCFCDLTDASSLDSFFLRLGQALEIRAQDESLQSKLRERLERDDGSTLVLDNFEQLAPDVDEWLGSCALSAARILITSRRHLARASTASVELRPLSIERRSGERWSDAALLLAGRMEAALGRTLDSAEEREELEEIARQLDGLPLALELGAARLRLLSPSQLLSRLSERFRLLARSDGISERGGLREAIEDSFALLGEIEQHALMALSVFRGGFSFAAAEAVLAHPEGSWALERLEALADHSLLAADEGPLERRYGLLLCIREFAQEKALGSPALLEEAILRHAAFYVSLAERELARPGADARTVLRRERENLFAILERGSQLPAQWVLRAALVLGAPEAGLPLALVDDLLSRAVERADGESDPRIGRALLLRGTVRRYRGRLQDSKADLLSVVARAKSDGDQALLAEAYAGLGNHASIAVDWAEARRNFRRARDIHPDPRYRALTLLMEGNAFCNEDDHANAEPLLLEAGREAERWRDRCTVARCLHSLGAMRLKDGALEEAHRLLTEALEEHRRRGAEHWAGIALVHLARWKQETGDLPGALLLYPEALACLEGAGTRRAAAIGSYQFATALLEAGESRAATQRLREALPAVRATCGDHEGMVFAMQAVIAMRSGATADAAVLLNRASSQTSRYPRRIFDASLRVLQGGDAPPKLARCVDVQLARRLRAPLPSPDRAGPLLIARDGSWFRTNASAERISLRRRKALPGVLRALAAWRQERPGRAMGLPMLVEAGWPGERMQAAAGVERVYTAIATLRRLGLRDVILQRGEGYLLSPELPLVIE